MMNIQMYVSKGCNKLSKCVVIGIGDVNVFASNLYGFVKLIAWYLSAVIVIPIRMNWIRSANRGGCHSSELRVPYP